MGHQEKNVVQEAQRQVESHQKRRRGEIAFHRLIGWWLLLLSTFFLAPWPLEDKVWAAAHGLCAQVDGHMLSFGGRPLPLCARDSGVYVGTLLGLVYLLIRGRWLAAGRPARWFWWAFGAVGAFFVVDVLNSVADDWFAGGMYRPQNVLRLSSGLLLGLGTAVLLLWAINLSFSWRQLERPILPHWGDLGGLAFLGALGGLLLWSGRPALYVPMVVLSMGAMLVLLLAGVFLWVISATKGKDLIEDGWEVGPPLLWASIASPVIMALLSWLRYYIGA